MRLVLTRVTLLLLIGAACGGGDEGAGPDAIVEPATSVSTDSVAATSPSTETPRATTLAPDGSGCADVIDVAVRATANSFTFDVTVRSDDLGWDKYADAWEVRDPAGTVLGTRELLHPHENEQPFTRSLSGVSIPGEVVSVVVAARDSQLGFCGETMATAIPGR